MKQVNILMKTEVHHELKIYAVRERIAMGRAVEQLLALAAAEAEENFNPADCEWSADTNQQ